MFPNQNAVPTTGLVLCIHQTNTETIYYANSPLPMYLHVPKAPFNRDSITINSRKIMCAWT